MLFLLMNGTITDEGMVPIAPIAELLILVRFIRFGVNTCKNANQVR